MVTCSCLEREGLTALDARGFYSVKDDVVRTEPICVASLCSFNMDERILHGNMLEASSRSG